MTLLEIVIYALCATSVGTSALSMRYAIRSRRSVRRAFAAAHPDYDDERWRR